MSMRLTSAEQAVNKCSRTGYPHYCKCPAKWVHNGDELYCGRHDPDQIKKRADNIARRTDARREEQQKISQKAIRVAATRRLNREKAAGDTKAFLKMISNTPPPVHPDVQLFFQQEAERILRMPK